MANRRGTFQLEVEPPRPLRAGVLPIEYDQITSLPPPSTPCSRLNRRFRKGRTGRRSARSRTWLPLQPPRSRPSGSAPRPAGRPRQACWPPGSHRVGGQQVHGTGKVIHNGVVHLPGSARRGVGVGQPRNRLQPQGSTRLSLRRRAGRAAQTAPAASSCSRGESAVPLPCGATAGVHRLLRAPDRIS